MEFDVQRLIAELRDEISLRGGALRAADDILDRSVAPALASDRKRVLDSLFRARDDPFVAQLIVGMTGETGYPVFEDPQRVLHADDVFDIDSIVAGASNWLRSYPDGGVEDGYWAWTAAFNALNQLSPSAHAEVVDGLIREVPNDERMLEPLADGPVRKLIQRPDQMKRLREWAAHDQKVARIFDLM
jgi:hypothetical protein